MENRKIDHINLKVPDMQKAIDFYTKTLNFKVTDRFNGFCEFVFMTDGNIVYELLEDKSLSTAYLDHIAFVSEDIQKDYEHFARQNLTTTQIGYIDFLFENGVYYFFIRGTANEKIEFCQKKG